MERSRSRFARSLPGVIAVTALLGFGTLVPGCTNFTQAARFRGTQTASVANASGAALSVETANGSIEVRRSSAPDITIVGTIAATTPERLAGTIIDAQRDGSGNLVVKVQWPEGGRSSSEGCSFVIDIPEASGVTLNSDNGALTLTGLTGPARLTTSNGRITVASHDGPIDARTSNGAITVTDATAKVSARSSNGAVTIAYTDGAEGTAEIETSNGRIDLTVGKSFAGTLALETSNGKIHCERVSGLTTNMKRTEGTVVFETPGGVSKAVTSNGSITIRRR